jgi:hypothetical protein
MIKSRGVAGTGNLVSTGHYQLVRRPVQRSDELMIQPPGTVKVSDDVRYCLEILQDRCVAPA